MGVGQEFAPGKVYVFARIYAPQEESLTRKWYNGKGEEFAARQFKVRLNLETGFRIYTRKPPLTGLFFESTSAFGVRTRATKSTWSATGLVYSFLDDYAPTGL